MIDYSPDVQQSCFPFLDEAAARTLCAELEPLALPAGEKLYAGGQAADALYFLLSGRLAVQHPTGFAERMQVVALLDTGAPVGEGGLLADDRHAATVTAATACRLAVLHRAAFFRLVAGEPVLAIDLLRWLLSRNVLRLRKSSERLAQVL